MTTPLSSVTVSNAYLPVASAAPVPNTAAVADLAVNLSSNASIIASLGGSSSSGAGVYNSQGLMDTILRAAAQNLSVSQAEANANNADTSNGTATDAGSAAATDANSGSQPASGSTSDTSAGAAGGSADATAFNGTPDWASVLKSNPSLTGVFLTDSTNQLLINQLSVFA